MKPMLAADYDEKKVRFPVMVQPKIDGVRGLNMTGGFTGRSLKTHKNVHTTLLYSKPYFIGLDGEMAAAAESDPNLCRITSSALGTIAGAPFTLWWVFDYVVSETRALGYYDRYQALQQRVELLRANQFENAGFLRVIPFEFANNIDELRYLHHRFIEEGYEGSILRDPAGKHKEGRSSPTQGGLLRIKDFIEAEAVVTNVIEGERNDNEAQENELGHTFRSTHQENMVPNGMVGSLTAYACADVKDGNRLVLEKGQVITISPGNMDHNDRRYYFENKREIIGKTVKFKFFPKGIKDKPRFPTFVCIRSAEDM